MRGNFEGFPLKKKCIVWVSVGTSKNLQNSKDLRNHLGLRLKTEEWQAYQAKFNSAQDAGWTGDQVKAGKIGGEKW